MQAIKLQKQVEEQFILNTPQYHKGMTTINLFTSCLLLNAFQNAGHFNKSGEEIKGSDLKNELLKSERHERLFFALLDILERHGYIQIKEDSLTVTSKANSNETKNTIEKLTRVERENLTDDQVINNHLWPIASFTREILDSIFEVLPEKKTYLEVLFPNNDFSKIESIYRGNVQQYQNKKLARIVRQKVDQLVTLHPGRTIKLLEVGAGTGMGTLEVLKSIKPYGEQLEFWFTDISSGFARRAKKRFSAEYPFMKFGALDISKPIAEQGFEHGDIDIVICTNVVHATPYIMDTFHHLRDLLTEGGHLVINDLSKRLDWTTVIFGLTEGWWYSQDPEHRIPHSPILSRENFESIFGQLGFEDIQSYGLEIIEKSDYPQSIITGVLTNNNG